MPAHGGLLITAASIAAAPTKQYARPTSDVSIVSWAPTPVYPRLQQPDAAILQSSATASPASSIGAVTNETLEVGLGAITDPNLDTGHTIFISHKTDVTLGSGTWTGVAKLKQGGTVIATWTIFPDGSGTYLTDTYTLTNLEAASISNYATLSVNVVWTLTNNAAALLTGHVFVSWIELQTPLPVIIVTSSFDGPYESLQLLNVASVDIYEALGSYITNGAYLYELKGYAFGTAVIPYEASGVVSTSSIINYEALALIVQSIIANYEATGIYSTSSIPLYELVGFARTTNVSPYEALGLLTATQIENYEALGALLQTSIDPYESVGSYSTSWINLYELLGYARNPVNIAYESLGLITIPAIAIYEALAFIPSTVIVNYEALGSYSTLGQYLYELMGYARQTAISPYDTEQLIQATNAILYEALGFLGINAISIWEAEGTGFIVSQAYLYELAGFATGINNSNYESSGPISNQNIIPWEAVSLVSVIQSATVIYEALQFLVQGNDVVYEAVSSILIVLNEIIANFEALSYDQFEGDTFILNSVTSDETSIDPGFTQESGGVAIAGECDTGISVAFASEVATPMLVFPEQEYVTPYMPDKPVTNITFSEESVVAPRYDTTTPIVETFSDADTSTDSNFTDS